MTTTIDTSVLDSAPRLVRESLNTRRRLYLVTTYSDGTTHHRTGRIGRTTGTIPCYLVMHRTNQIGSWDTLTEDDWEPQIGHTEARTQVMGVQHSDGKYYRPFSNTPIKPGKNRFED